MNIYLVLALAIFLLSGGCLGGSSDTATPPPIQSPRLTLSDITAATGANTADITWTTNAPSDSIVRYGAVSGKYDMSEGDRDYVTSHNVTLEGFIPGNTYYYKVGSVDPDGVASQSREYNFTTVALPLPVISNVSAYPTSTTALIDWTTDISSDSAVGYSTTSGKYDMSEGSRDYVTKHNVTLEGLVPGYTYYYKAGSTDPNGASNESEEFKFKAEPASLRERIIAGNLEISLKTFGSYFVKSGDITYQYSRATIAIKNTGEEKIPLTITSTAIVDKWGYQSDMVSVGAPDEFRPTELFPGGQVTRALYYEKMSGPSGTLHVSINSKPYQFHVS